MCIAVWLWQSHPLYPFILLFNRDEYHNRSTSSIFDFTFFLCYVLSVFGLCFYGDIMWVEFLNMMGRRGSILQFSNGCRSSKPAAWWEEVPQILGGRDCRAGGTWLACSRDGRVAFLTNFREPQVLPDAKTRGDLPVRFLQSAKSPLEFALEVKREGCQYNGFNLILADLCTKKMAYVTNRYKGEALHAQEVLPGCHVLTNANLDSPWPKGCDCSRKSNFIYKDILDLAERLGRNFKDLIQQYGGKEIHEKNMVEKLMNDTVKAERNMLPGTGHDPEWEFSLSSIFVETDTKMGRYGTSSMVGLSAKTTGEVTFYERYLEQESWKEQTIVYQIENQQ
ncbi:hypothetical protein EJ110_NYTH03193 [Nymphaea thermarum]|nr:hypothetical protein EJ110_NYTH03193 [Nymphaea thermarum]